MKITFYSNFMTHHQLPFCLEMQKKYGDDFKFVSTVKINEERISLGYKDMDRDYDFIIRAYESENEHKKAMDLAINSDVVIMGSTLTDEFGVERLKYDKLTFRYYARIFYNGIDFKNLKVVYNKHFKYRKNKKLYLLCASGYGPNDFNKFGMYKNKCFKWGYFPAVKTYDVNLLIQKKELNNPIKILWVGRFIKEKHPEYMVKLAEKLMKANYKFKIEMIGNGELFEKTKNQILKNKLEDYIELVGSVSSDNVRTYMEKSNIFVCTSDKTERWGVVLNEAMNSACAVITNKDVGAVPFLIQSEENGLLYSNFNNFYDAVQNVILDEALRDKISINAYNTIRNKWTAENACTNFSKLIDDIINSKTPSIKEGPASLALPSHIKISKFENK